MSAFTLRDELAALLSEDTWPPVHNEQPEAIAPPGYVVRWIGTRPSGSGRGMSDHDLMIEVWPSTDLASTAHYTSRDDMVTRAIELVRKWTPSNAGVSGWEAGLDERQIGGTDYRIATIIITTAETNC